MLQAPTLTTASQAAELITTHNASITDQDNQVRALTMPEISLHTLDNPPAHPLWMHLTRQVTSTTHPYRPITYIDNSEANPHSNTRPLYILKNQLKSHTLQTIIPDKACNTLFQAFFPTLASLRVYATTSKLSWALGQLVTNQHPLMDHLHRTGRSPSAICPVCHSEAETVQHFLYQCPGFQTAHTKWCNTWQQQRPQLHQSDKTTMYSFYHLAAHTESRRAIRALDEYVVTTKRFFNSVWLTPYVNFGN